jgi:hypothetical protein
LLSCNGEGAIWKFRAAAFGKSLYRNITNPVGLILATVPQSFSGYSFDTFRQRRQEK